MEHEQEITSGELTEDDKSRKDTLDDVWIKFNEGLEDANLIIQKINVTMFYINRRKCI